MKKITISLLALVFVCCMGVLFSACSPEEPRTNSIGMEFVLIPAGSFHMGANENFENTYNHEIPTHRVTLSKPFYLGKYEVTQEQWMAIIDRNPSEFKGRNNPVEQVSWNDVQEFIYKLNQKEKTWTYRLPTEAEWEYAARAGTQTIYSFGDDAIQLGTCAWYMDNANNSTHSVGQKTPNSWGLYDMHGNVWEWVQDWFGSDYYHHSPGIDPEGPASGIHKVVRGSSWTNAAGDCRSATRGHDTPETKESSLGFCLVRSLE